LFAALYGSLYAVLQSEDEALLLGSLMVFTLLAIVMITTRKVDWSEVARRMVPPKAAVPQASGPG
jgi:inner membrane protein